VPPPCGQRCLTEGGGTAPWGGRYHRQEQVNESGHGGSAYHLNSGKARVKGGIASVDGRNVKAPCDPETGWSPPTRPRVRPQSRAGFASAPRAGRRWPRHSPGSCRDCAATRPAADRGPWSGGRVSGPRRSVERGHGSVGAGARRGPRPYASGAAAVLSRPQPLNGQPRRRHLHSPLPRSEARKRARSPQAAARCGTGRGVPRADLRAVTGRVLSSVIV
jgi:hypothetical protein